MAEDRMIEAIAGPYRGQRLTVPGDVAELAITDGWASDPFAPPDPKAKPKEWDMAKVEAAAEAAARRLRGEDKSPDKKPAKAKDAPASADRAMATGDGGEGEYLNRASTSAKAKK